MNKLTKNVSFLVIGKSMPLNEHDGLEAHEPFGNKTAVSDEQASWPFDFP